ncbi:receptor-interacting serine/threonine-protein kinase 2-like [Stigmatopora argus]
MWEVLSRQIPYDEVSNPMKIMFNVLRGMRPDTGPDSLSRQIPGRDTLVCLMTCGWTANTDQRPSFLECLLELEPMVMKYTEIDFLVAVLQIKKSRHARLSWMQAHHSVVRSMLRQFPSYRRNLITDLQTS